MRFGSRARSALGALACAAALGAPLGASAQPFSDEHVSGVVQSFDGQERLTLRDDRGYIDDVSLGEQTRITPEGARLTPGARIRITGYNGGKWLDATAIEVIGGGPAPVANTPSYAQPNTDPSYPQADPAPSYQYPYPQAYAAPYPYPVYAYPYPVYAYPVPVYGYGSPGYYGPRVSIGLGFVFGGHWGGWHR
jgi:hypothetical protein